MAPSLWQLLLVLAGGVAIGIGIPYGRECLLREQHRHVSRIFGWRVE